MNIKSLNIKQKIVFIVASIVVAIAALLILNPPRGDNQFKLTIKTVPNDATIYVNNRKYKAPFNKYLDKGDYKIKIERFGFASKEKTIKLEKDDIEAFGLSPIAEEQKQWAKSNQDKYLEIEAIIGQKLQQKGVEKGAEHPILTKLPIIKSSYQIGTKVDEKGNIIIIIHSPKAYQFLAVKDLLETRQNLAGYKIEYVDDSQPNLETNPFKILAGERL